LTIALLQLSDIHFKKDDNSVLNKIEKIFDAIKNEVDTCKYLFIVFTGDIAFSGQKDEYRQAEILINDLQTRIRNYNNNIKIEFIFTPGNHDCDFSQNEEVRNMIIDNIVQDPSKITPALISTCVETQKEYLNFVATLVADENINRELSNNIFSRYEYNIDTYKIAFNSYNLAWVSKKQESQSKVIYPTGNINKGLISNEDYNLTISLFHHPLHWLEHSNMRSFKELVNSTSNIVLTGHEHVHTAKKESPIDTNQYIEYIEAGALQESSNADNSSFNLLILDLKDKKQDIFEFNWNLGIYVKNDTHCNIPLPFSKKTIYQFKEEYKKKLNTLGLKVTHPTKENMSLEDIFIYPDLQVINSEAKNKKIFLEENSKRFKSMNEIGHSIIYGAETSGKTSLSRILQLKHKRDGQAPVIIQGKEIKSNDIDTLKIKRLIEKCFKKQYDCDIGFEQINKSQVLLFIDDFQDAKLNSEYKSKFIQVLQELNYENILLFAHSSLQLEATTESELAKSLSGFNHYKLLEFGHKLREEIIQKWISLGQETVLDRKNLLLKTKEKSAAINTTVGYNIVPSYPIYLLTLLQAMESNETNSLSKSSYGYYYEFLIMKYLNANSPMRPKDLNTIFTYTSTLAFECLGEKHSFTLEELNSFNKRYCNQKRFTPTFSIIKKLVESNILKLEDENEYKFSHGYIYYFFVAKYLADNIGKVEIQKVVKGMCERLYRLEFANIIMFLIHHSPQDFILETIVKEAEKVFSEIPEFTFNPDELIKINSSIKGENLRLVNRTLEESRKIEVEQNEKSDKLKKINHVYDVEEADYNEAILELDQFAKLNLAFKMIEILGEITKNYSGSLDGDIKYKLIRETYGAGLRSLKSLLGFFEENHEQLVEEIKEVIARKHHITDDKIYEEVGNMVFSLISSISTGIIKKIAKAIASKDLTEIYKEILMEDKENIAIQLINHGIELDFQGGLNVSKIEKIHKLLIKNNNRLTDSVLKKMVLEHIYMFDVNISKKQSICAKLDINSDNTKKEMIKQIKK